MNEDGVKAVLEDVGTEAESIGKDLSAKKFESISDAAMGGFNGIVPVNGISMCVPAAIGNLFENQEANLEAIGKRIQAGIVGVAVALGAYSSSQKGMCSEIQSRMLKAAEDGDMSWFVSQGYFDDPGGA